ncbi:MAG: hypothetical protein WC501_03000 [Candidatus Micrarchaeia archaeon]|jgi:tRNA splicing endonuclease
MRESENQKLKNLGFGTVTKNGDTIFNEYELRYCFEKGYINKKTKFTGNEDIYAVFKNLRQNGIISRMNKDIELIRVYQKGYRPGEDRTKYLMKVFGKKDIIEREDLAKFLQISKKMRKELIFAFVCKNEIEYIKISHTALF